MCSTYKTVWKNKYRDALKSDNTIECLMCAYMLCGNNDTTIDYILCWDCWNSGVIHDHRLICMECAEDNNLDGPSINHKEYPDGFTCDECGEVRKYA